MSSSSSLCCWLLHGLSLSPCCCPWPPSPPPQVLLAPCCHCPVACPCPLLLVHGPPPPRLCLLLAHGPPPTSIIRSLSMLLLTTMASIKKKKITQIIPWLHTHHPSPPAPPPQIPLPSSSISISLLLVCCLPIMATSSSSSSSPLSPSSCSKPKHKKKNHQEHHTKKKKKKKKKRIQKKKKKKKKTPPPPPPLPPPPLPCDDGEQERDGQTSAARHGGRCCQGAAPTGMHAAQGVGAPRTLWIHPEARRDLQRGCPGRGCQGSVPSASLRPGLLSALGTDSGLPRRRSTTVPHRARSARSGQDSGSRNEIAGAALLARRSTGPGTAAMRSLGVGGSLPRPPLQS